jgi:hypothetical protein
MNEEEKPRLRFAHIGVEPPWQADLVKVEPSPTMLIAIHHADCRRDDCVRVALIGCTIRRVSYCGLGYGMSLARCALSGTTLSEGPYTMKFFEAFLGEALVPTNKARQILWEQRPKRHTGKAKPFDAEDILSELDPVRIDVQSEYDRCFLRRELASSDAGL